MDHITRRKILVRWGAHVSALSDSDCCFSFWLANGVNKNVKEEMKWKLSLLHLQDLLKVIKNVFYSFSISHFVLELFRFVWNVNETTCDVKLCTDHIKLLESRV